MKSRLLIVLLFFSAYVFSKNTTNPPVANFTINKSNPHAKELIVFSDTSVNNPTSWSWQFGDDALSNLQKVLNQKVCK